MTAYGRGVDNYRQPAQYAVHDSSGKQIGLIMGKRVGYMEPGSWSVNWMSPEGIPREVHHASTFAKAKAWAEQWDGQAPEQWRAPARGKYEQVSPGERQHSEAELQALVTAFESAYPDRTTYSYVKDQTLLAISATRAHSHHAASFPDQIKTREDMEYYVFDKVVPLLKAAGFPKLESKAFANVMYQFQMSLLPASEKKT